MNRKLLAVILVLLCCASVTYWYELLRAKLRGVVDVPPVLAEREVAVVVDSSSGERVYDLGVVRVPSDGFVKAVAALEGVSGSFKLLMSGTLVLRSPTQEYRIAMPCLVVVNETCFRVQVLLPGYDEPLPIRAGEYRATLAVAWNGAAGRGTFELRLSLVYSSPKTIVSLGQT